ncbi:MAG TPA: flagellar motor protein MotB [Candidatus Sulfotelmatobacter sp.]
MARRRVYSNHERWLVSYADFVTLLFAFFVVLYASSRVDQHKAGKLAVAIQAAFQQLGVFPSSPTMMPLLANESVPFATVQAINNAKHTSDLHQVASAPEGSLEAAEEEADLSALQNQLKEALGNEISLHEVDLHQNAEGLVISMREFAFFDSGSVILKPTALPTLDHIASLLALRTYQLRTEGHTDNVPIHNAQISSNWELSTARATALVRLFVLRYRFDPARLSAAGYAEFHPIASNNTAQGRALNRRIDFVILK